MKSFISFSLLIILTHLSPLYGQWSYYTIDPMLPLATIIDVGDIDKDGDLDIAANGSPYTRWYQFNDTDTTWTIYNIDSTLLGAVGIAVVDIDGDSSLDVVASGYDSDDIRWYKNEGGNPISWHRYFIDDDFLGAEALSVGDIDGDDDPDVVVTSSYGNSVAWYENKMPDTNWTRHILDDGGLLGSIVCEIGDLDSDGDLDIVATGRFADDVVWYKNNLPNTNWNKKWIDGNLHAAWGIAVADIDGDDTMDVVATSSSTPNGNKIVWYKTTDLGETWNLNTVYPDYFYGARNVYIADMDLDGDNDIVATAFDAGVVAWFENRLPLPGNWLRYNIDENLPTANYVCTTDIFSDDTLDVLATGRHSNLLRMYRQPIVNVELLSNIPPADYKLMQNYPNPFNPETAIRFDIPEMTFVIVRVYDLLGNEVETLVDEEKYAGTYEITWYAGGLPSGVYFYQLKAGSFVQTKKMLLMK